MMRVQDRRIRTVAVATVIVIFVMALYLHPFSFLHDSGTRGGHDNGDSLRLKETLADPPGLKEAPVEQPQVKEAPAKPPQAKEAPPDPLVKEAPPNLPQVKDAPPNPPQVKEAPHNPLQVKEVPPKGASANPPEPKEAPDENVEKIHYVRDGERKGTEIERQSNMETSLLAPAHTSVGCMDLDRDKALVMGHRRKDKGFLTIGITNAKRKNVSYLKLTLQSLIENASEQDRSHLTIVVFACDFEDKDRQEAHDIVSSFPEHVQSGLLQLIEAPKTFYPPLTNLKRTYNDPVERVRWRSKENIDNVFLFTYSVTMSDYYLLLDDDLITFPGYVQTIRNFITKHQADHWAFLDISELGTGKLFRDEDLLRFAQSLAQFFQEQPVDLLLHTILILQGQQRHLVVVPPLFTHLGKVSTLDLKNNPK